MRCVGGALLPNCAWGKDVESHAVTHRWKMWNTGGGGTRVVVGSFYPVLDVEGRLCRHFHRRPVDDAHFPILVIVDEVFASAIVLAIYLLALQPASDFLLLLLFFL